MSTLRVDNIKSRTGSVLTVPETNTLAVTGIVSVTSSGSLQVAGNETIGGNQTVSGNQTITGNQLISGITTVTGVARFTGDVSIGGTLTYEDVTNVDSVGLITARNGINMSGGTATFAGDIDANGGANISGGSGLVANTVAATNLNSGRVTYAAGGGQLADSANLIFNGTTLTANKVAVTDDINANGSIIGDGSTNISGINQLTASTFSGSGASLTSLPAAQVSGTLGSCNASNLTSIPAAQVSGTLGSCNGSNVTNINASNISSGTISASRVPTLNQNTTGNASTATVAGAITVVDESTDTTCYPLFADGATGNLSARSGTNLTFNSANGTLTATIFAGRLENIPASNKTSGYTTVKADAGTMIRTNSNVTIGANIYTAGDIISIYNNSGSDITIQQSGTTLRKVGTSDTGNITLAQRGLMTVTCVSSNEFVCSGGGMS
tara:strand:- start:5844 stop:7163 length:1320 start_codon:yes stop_codon:yes gene_type:complete